MRAFSADIVFPIHLPPVKNGVIVMKDDGMIIDFLDPLKDEISASLSIEKLNGILCPGFVNTHCHLELSHLKGKISQKKNLPGFIGELLEMRNARPEETLQAMVDADLEMYDEGIVAVGDISNSSASLHIKKASRIYYHTFVEVFDIFPERAGNVLTNGRFLRKEFTDHGLKASIVPHAPYTVSERLMKMLSREAVNPENLVCIHNQETASENEMFEKGTGFLIDKLHALTGAYDKWKPTGNSSLASYIETFPSASHLQLVHNTFSKKNDVQFASEKHQSLFWCLCVNANLYIEDTIPDIPMMIDEHCVITIGTDSYASNTSLSVMNELKMIHNKFPEIYLAELLEWATLNGAKFLKIDNLYGSFEKGKIPGVNLITGIEVSKLILHNDIRVQRVV